MPLTPELRRAIDRIRDYLFAGGYPDPAQNAEQPELPDLLLHVRGGRCGAGPRRTPSRSQALRRRVRWRMDAAEPAQRSRTGFGDGSARDAALVGLGECAQRPAARVLGARGGLPLPRRDRGRGRHRLHGGCAARDRRADGALAGHQPRERPAPRTGGRGYQGRPVRARIAPDPAGRRVGTIPHAPPRHPRHGPACRSPSGRNGPRPGSRHGGVPGRRVRPHPARELVGRWH